MAFLSRNVLVHRLIFGEPWCGFILIPKLGLGIENQTKQKADKTKSW